MVRMIYFGWWNAFHEAKVFPTVTPSFEPKQGKYMAYNDRNKILIVDTTNWAVKKTLQEGEVGFRFGFLQK